MQFKAGSEVIAADGTRIGRVRSVVMTPREQEITGIIIDKGARFDDERVLPIRLIETTDDIGTVRLRSDVNIDSDLVRFHEAHYVSADERPDDGLTSGTDRMVNRDLAEDRREPGLLDDDVPVPPALYYHGAPGYFPVNFSFGLAAAPVTGSVPLDTPSGEGAVPAQIEEETDNIPEGTVAVTIDAQVYTSDEERVGIVEEIFTSRDGRHTTHFLIAKGFLFQKRKLVPVDWIDEVQVDKVFLSVNKSLLERLPDYDTHNWRGNDVVSTEM